MVFLPRFWGGLPYPPSYLVEASKALRFKDEMDTSDLPTLSRKHLSTPNIASSSPHEVTRLVQSESPTPIGQPLEEVTTIGSDDALVKMALFQVLQDKTDAECDILSFIQHVLRFTPQDIPRRRDGYILDKDLCRQFSKRTYSKHDTSEEQVIRGERACCHAFQYLAWDLIRQLQDRAADERPFPAVLMYLHDHIVGGDFASYKPDFVYGPSVGPKLQKWEFAGACGEMKKREVTKMPTEHARTITNDRLRKFKLDWVDRERTRDETSSTSVPVIPQRRRKRKATVQPISRANKKVKMGKVAAPAPVTHIDTKYLVDFTGEEIQMAKYVNELLSHGIRTYAFGFLLRETSMSLWYVDRMGMASSKSFDIFKSPELLLLVVGALNFADRHSLGFNPLVEYPKGATQSHDGAILKLPHAIRDDGTAVTSPVKFDIRISRTSPLVVAYGAVGRGTTVIPIRTKGSARKLWGEGNLVAKLSWPSINRKNEADTIRVVRKKLGEHDEARAYLRNIVELKCSSELSAMDMKLPRAFMDLREPHEPRVFRALVMKEYLPLERIASLEEFKTVYIHVIDAHYWVHKVVGILHRDPCVDNIMFYYDDKHDVVGVLSDWDVSTQKELTYLRDVPDTEDAVEEEGDPMPPRPDSNCDSDTTRRPRYRTGKGAFMAIDLLRPVPVTHRYRHDLESFFYLLCYFCAQFRHSSPENPEARLAYLLDWENGSMAKISSKKQDFLLGADAFSELFKNVDETYRPLIDQWIEPLREGVFEDVYDYSWRLSKAYAKLTVARGRHDDRKEQHALREIQRISEEADDAVSYEVFREILKR